MSLVLKVTKQDVDLQTRKIDKILDMSDEDSINPYRHLVNYSGQKKGE